MKRAVLEGAVVVERTARARGERSGRPGNHPVIPASDGQARMDKNTTTTTTASGGIVDGGDGDR